MSEKIPDGWKKVKLGEFVDIITGKLNSNAGVVDGKYPFFTCAPKPLRINEFAYDLDAILLAGNNANGIFHIHRYKGKFNAYQRTYIITEKNKEVSLDYIFYSLKLLLNYMKEASFGSATKFLTIGILKDLEILLPPLSEQKAIAGILSSLDDKIDLLHRQNKTLEEMAQTLFRKWFIEDVQEDWEEVRLGDIVEIKIGRTPPRKEFQWFSKIEDEKNMKWVSVKDLGKNGVFILKTDEFLTKEAVQKFNIPIIPSNTVLLSFKMTIGRVGITTEEMVSNEAIAHFIFNQTTPITTEYLYLFLKSFKFQGLGSTSTIVTSINSSMIKAIKIIVPDKNTMTRFHNYVSKLFEKIKDNQFQIRTLEQLRDTLLPKLMSGEVRVKL